MVVPRDEVEVLHGRRVERRFDRREPGAGDRPGREPRPNVRVERMLDPEIGARERAPFLAGRILDRGVGLERHVELEPIPEDPGDGPQLVALRRPTPPDPGEGEETVYASPARL